MLLATALLLVGFIVIIWSADQVVLGASAIARRFSVSPMLIGLTIVAMGTSAPEIVVSITASLSGNTGLAIGNAIGSNIANIGLVLGLTALISPLVVQSDTLKREYPIMCAVMLFSFILIIDGWLTPFESGLLLLGLLSLMSYMVHLAHTSRNDKLNQEFAAEISTTVSMPFVRLLIGLVLLPLSAKLIVHAAVFFANYFGMSDELIGLTIIAIGTSLPEVATSISGALKGEDDIAIGNVLGSNMFNLLAVLPFAALYKTSPVSHAIIYRDFPVMVVLSLLLLLFVFRAPRRLDKIEGGLLLTLYLAYLAWVVVLR